jgi:hypothetical protein
MSVDAKLSASSGVRSLAEEDPAAQADARHDSHSQSDQDVAEADLGVACVHLRREGTLDVVDHVTRGWVAVFRVVGQGDLDDVVEVFGQIFTLLGGREIGPHGALAAEQLVEHHTHRVDVCWATAVRVEAGDLDRSDPLRVPWRSNPSTADQHVLGLDVAANCPCAAWPMVRVLDPRFDDQDGMLNDMGASGGPNGAW